MSLCKGGDGLCTAQAEDDGYCDAHHPGLSDRLAGRVISAVRVPRAARAGEAVSADADRCPLCGLGRMTDPMCRERRCMPTIEEVRPRDGYPADRIAQLTAELDEKHAKLVEIADSLRAERAAHERTKAELARVTEQRDDEEHVKIEYCDERDAALERERAAQAEVAALKAGATQTQLLRELDDRALTKAQADAAATVATILGLVCSDCSASLSLTAYTVVGRAIAERVTLLEAQAKLNDLRRRCAVALFDECAIDSAHEDGCPEDDTCDCPLTPLVHAVLNVDEHVDVAAAEGALAALDAKEQG